MASGLPGGGPALVAGTVRPRGVAGAARRGRRPRRIRWRTEVSAVGAARGAAAQLRAHRRAESLAAVERTCAAMARGGIYDQLAGGFARYSVDASWVVPHFEKMLYDNALLLRVYAHWARRTGNPLARKVARETATVPDATTSARRHVHLVAGRRHRRARGTDVRVDAAAVARRARRRRRALGRKHCSPSPRRARSSTAARCCSCRSTPTTPARFERVRAGVGRRTGAGGRSPAATTRWSPRGTASRSPRWRRRRWRSASPNCSTPQRRAHVRSSTCTSSTDGCGGPASAGGSATVRRILEDHAALGDRPADAVPDHRRRRLADCRVRPCSTSRSTHFADPDRTAAGSTPPTTPSS